MRIDAILARKHPVFSFEFSPPKTEAGTKALFDTIAELKPLKPDFVSVTYGAGGSARAHTIDIVGRIRRELDIEPMAHFTCVGASVADLHEVLRSIEAAGIENVLALRGDPPKGDPHFVVHDGGLAHGSDLAELISSNYKFCVGGACYPETHPETESMADEIAFTRAKVDASASFLITQLFFDNRAYFSFVDAARASGITVPIIPGLMPVTNVAQIRRFMSQIGATMPQDLLDAFDERSEDPQAVVDLGVAWTTLQASELLANGAPGIHFYTLNRSPATRAILSALRIARPWDQREGGK